MFCVVLSSICLFSLHEISNNVVCATSKASDQPAHTRSLIRAFAGRLTICTIVKLLAEHHLEFLSLKRGYTGSYEYAHVIMPHCWKSHVAAHLLSFDLLFKIISDFFVEDTRYWYNCI